MPALDQLHAYLRPRLTAWKDRLPTTLMHTAYTGMAAGVLWPLVAAMQGGDMAVITTFMGLLNSVGAGLLTNAIQQWKDEASASLAIDTAPAALRADLDKVLAALEAPRLATEALREDDRAWFERTLKDNLSALGNRTVYEQAGALNIMVQEGATVQGNTLVAGNQTITHITHNYFGSELPNLDLAPKVHAYLHWLSDRFSTITLPGIERQSRQVLQLPLSDMYVPLHARRDSISGSDVKTMPMRNPLFQDKRVIIVGGPGSGKTTVLLHLAYALALALGDGKTELAEKKIGLMPPWPLPIYLPVSAFARHVRDLPAQADPHERTLARYISRHLIERQSAFKLPADFFERLLATGDNVLLLLDGLDEVPNEKERAVVREAIEDLVAGRDQLRVVATCRTTAYHGRTFLKNFTAMYVEPLADRQIARLAIKAYACMHPQHAQCKKRVKDLLTGIKKIEARYHSHADNKVDRLITTPLMMRLLFIVHAGDRHLPEQRAELYQKAVEAMLRPDYALDERSINDIESSVGGSMETHRELLQTLAFIMHQRGKEQGQQVDEAGLQHALRAMQAETRQLIAITRTRGTVLEERDGLYRFVHLGFQEFLVARHLAEVIRGQDAIAQFLLTEDHARNNWWDEVWLLVVNYLALTSPSNARDLVDRLVGTDSHPTQPSADIQQAATTLALRATQESFPQPTAWRMALAKRLIARVTEPSKDEYPAVGRARLGQQLAETIGDPRPEVTSIEAMPFVLIPAGPFWMGNDAGAALEQPGHECTVTTHDYWLARYPVTVAQWQTFCRETQHVPNLKIQQDPVNHPVRWVTWTEALQFCDWLNHRFAKSLAGLGGPYRFTLPSEAEWEKAARGGRFIPRTPMPVALASLPSAQGMTQQFEANPQPKRLYPWGDNAESNAANVLMPEGIGTTNTVGIFPRGASPYGCLEMLGNVWEWTRSLWDADAVRPTMDYPYAEPLKARETLTTANAVEPDAVWADSSATTPTALNRRITRGGSWGYTDVGPTVATRRGDDPAIISDVIGFRVAVSHAR